MKKKKTTNKQSYEKLVKIITHVGSSEEVDFDQSQGKNYLFW